MSEYGVQKANDTLQKVDNPFLQPVYSVKLGNNGHADVNFAYCIGKSAEDGIKIHSQNMGWKMFLKYALEISGAISDLHQGGIIHGDLSLSNIVFTDSGACVTDWYYTLLMEQEDIIDVLKLCKPIYLAPEILEGTQTVFTTSTDVYAYAMCLLAMLGNRIPWSSLRPKEIIQRIKSSSRPAIATVQDDPHGLYEDVTTLIKECLHQDPSQRPTVANIISRLQVIQAVLKANAAVEDDLTHVDEKHSSQNASRTQIGSTVTKYLRTAANSTIEESLKWANVELEEEEPKDVERNEPVSDDALTYGRKHGIRLESHIEYTVHNPRVGAHVMMYHVVFCSYLIINVVLMGLIFTQTMPGWKPLPQGMDSGALGLINLGVCTLVRTELFLQFLYWFVCKLGKSLPNYFKVWATEFLYQVPGGLHSSSGLSGTVWLVAYTFSEWIVGDTGPGIVTGVISGVWTSITAIFLSVCLCIIVVLSIPAFRHKFHNTFEKSHRFLGWILMPILWAHVCVKAYFYSEYTLSGPGDPVLRGTNCTSIEDTIGCDPEPVSYSSILFSRPNFYLAIILCVLIYHPWFFVRKRRVRTKVLKKGAVMMIDGFPGFGSAGHFGRISTSWTSEWHPFAVISDKKDKEKSSRHAMIIARAGDWTAKRINEASSKHRRKYFTVRLIRSPGFMYTTRMWNRIVCVASGAGIAPVLPCLLQQTASIYVVWITSGAEGFGPVRGILEKYGQDKVWIHDTKIKGRPDVVSLSVKACFKENAEALYIVANLPLTYAVVRGCRALKIPAFGAIWDS